MVERILAESAGVLGRAADGDAFKAQAEQVLQSNLCGAAVASGSIIVVCSRKLDKICGCGYICCKPCVHTLMVATNALAASLIYKLGRWRQCGKPDTHYIGHPSPMPFCTSLNICS